MTTAQPLQIPFTEFHETGNFIHSQTTKPPKFQENTQNIWNSQKNDVPLRVNKQNSQKTSHMPTLTWIGKEKVVNHHLDVPFRVLDRQYTFGDTPDSGNKIIHGDNLEALKALLPEYEGKIKCIYIDPPYNTGNEKWVYNDNVNDPHIRKWLGQVVGSEMDDLTRHDKWLCMMYPRLVLLQKLLKDDGAIFISIDDNEISTLRLLCDEIFGVSNFVGQMTLQSNPRGSQNSNYLSYVHEYILMYAKKINKLTTLGVDKDEKSLAEFKEVDENGRRYRLLGLRKRGGEWKKEDRPNMYYPIYVNEETGGCSLEYSDRYTIEVIPKRPTGELSRWTWSKEKFEQERNKLIGKSKNTGDWDIFRKDYIDDDNGVQKLTKLKTIWVEKEINYQNARNEIKELFGNSEIFDYPKPTYLIERLLSIIPIGEDDIILDSFAGSGTTAHAVLKMNAQMNYPARKFIIIEMGEYANRLTAERVKRVISNNHFQSSFDFYELGDTLFDPKTENLNDNANTEQIRQYVWYSETHAPYIAPTAEHHPYWLGTDQRTNYYFYYIKGEETCLSWDFLRTLTPERDKAEMYIIYADRCVLTENEMQKLNIRFKKIPRDIKRV